LLANQVINNYITIIIFFSYIDITIIISTKGSGKTTQIPQFVIDDIGDSSNNILPLLSNKDRDSNRYKMIAVTQPRRIAATSVAKRVSDERKQKTNHNNRNNMFNNNNKHSISNVGGEVGYSVRFDDRSSNVTRLKYLTDGILVYLSINLTINLSI
jgi:HrpA-like RNA helicase